MVHLTIDATLHSGTFSPTKVDDKVIDTAREEHHFCEQCADDYDREEGMNDSRNLLQLSDFYRSKLYDQLEAAHPIAFYDGEDREKASEAAGVMIDFLRQKLAADKIELNDDAFGMLLVDFIGSAHFYTRRDEFNRKKL
jgi:hypothetical protein